MRNTVFVTLPQTDSIETRLYGEIVGGLIAAGGKSIYGKYFPHP